FRPSATLTLRVQSRRAALGLWKTLRSSAGQVGREATLRAPLPASVPPLLFRVSEGAPAATPLHRRAGSDRDLRRGGWRAMQSGAEPHRLRPRSDPMLPRPE